QAADAKGANVRTAALQILPGTRLHFGAGICALGLAATYLCRQAGAEEAYTHGLHIYEKPVIPSPQVPRYQGYPRLILDRLAQLHRERGNLTGALEFSKRAVQHQRAAFVASPGSLTYAPALQQHYQHLAETLLDLGDYEQAARAAHDLANVICRCPI